MTDASISQLKNHLPQIVHDVESGEDIHITRHGKPVAVIISLEHYNHTFDSGKGIYSACQKWRTLYPEANGFTDKELVNMRDNESHQTSSSCWDE